MLLWFLTPVLTAASLIVWLDMGLGVPKFSLTPRDRRGIARPGPARSVCTPRNGGEKNYVGFPCDSHTPGDKKRPTIYQAAIIADGRLLSVTASP